MPIQISALPADAFAHFFSLSARDLPVDARRMVATGKGEPCRVSLTDAREDEVLLLIHFEHQTAATPFRASHAIYVREGVAQARPDPDEVPSMLHSRLLSVRAFDAEGMLRAGDVVDGTVLRPVAEAMLADQDVAYLHLHAARYGCYLARVDRA